MLSLAREAGLSVPLLAGIKGSNAVHLAWHLPAGAAGVPAARPGAAGSGCRSRRGPTTCATARLVDLAELLLQAGYELQVYDPDLDPARLIGANFALPPSIAATLRAASRPSSRTAAAGARLAILGKPCPASANGCREALEVLDLTRLRAPAAMAPGRS